MSQSASQYPISQVITSIMQDHGYSPVVFVQSLGYRNIERGLRRLEPWLNQGTGFEKILKQIAARFPDQSDQIAKAVAETKTVKTAEFEAAWVELCKAEAGTFRPFIHAVGEKSVPSQIVFFGISGAHKRWTDIEIPQNILDLPDEDQLAALAELMHRYREDNGSKVPFFGALTGFKFVRLLDYLRFDKEGRFIEQVNRPFRSAPCSVRIL